MANSPGGRPEVDDSVNLLDLALVLAARKRFILLFSFSAAVLTAILVLIMPVTYTATTTMLPPQQEENSAMAMLGQTWRTGVAWRWWSGRHVGLKNPDDLYIGLLQSESVTDGIIRHFDLVKVYKAKQIERCAQSC